LAEVCMALEADSDSTRALCEMLCKAMDEAQARQEKLIKALAPSTTEVTVQAPESPAVAYTFNVIRDKDGQMLSVDVTPKESR
jgi:hypothetical protein